MSHDLLIEELSSQLTPVQRRSIARETIWLAGLGALELALFLAVGAMRSDMAQQLGHPFMWWKLGSPAVLAAVSIMTALRSFSPVVSPRRGLLLLAGLFILTALAGTMVGSGGSVAATFAGRVSPVHGLVCAASIVALSLPMLGMLSIHMRRGASVHPEGSALAVGVAGGCWGAFVFAFCCPVNDPLYVMLWYSGACAVTALLARLVLPRFPKF